MTPYEFPRMTRAVADDATAERPPTCEKCGDYGITLRGNSTFERCDCQAGRARLRPLTPPCRGAGAEPSPLPALGRADEA